MFAKSIFYIVCFVYEVEVEVEVEAEAVKQIFAFHLHENVRRYLKTCVWRRSVNLNITPTGAMNSI